MPLITAIKPQKNNKRLNIYLDGKFGFGIDLENFVKLKLKVEQELEDKQIEEIVKKAEFQKTFEKILRFVTLRPRSEKEISNWLRRKKIHESLHKDLFIRLNRLDLVNDRKFAEWWIGQRQAFRPRGVRALTMELRQKGIKKEVIGEVLAETTIDEFQIAKKLLERRSYKWKNLPEPEAKRKMSQFLAGKGFGWEVISKLIRNTSFEE